MNPPKDGCGARVQGGARTGNWRAAAKECVCLCGLEGLAWGISYRIVVFFVGDPVAV